MQKLRTLFTNPLSILILAGVLLFVLLLASYFPSDSLMARVIQFVAVSSIATAILPCQAWVVWRVRAAYQDIKGEQENISPAARAQLTGSLYIALALSNCAAAILLSLIGF